MKSISPCRFLTREKPLKSHSNITDSEFSSWDAQMTDVAEGVRTEEIDVYNIRGKDIIENNLGTRGTASKKTTF